MSAESSRAAAPSRSMEPRLGGESPMFLTRLVAAFRIADADGAKLSAISPSARFSVTLPPPVLAGLASTSPFWRAYSVAVARICLRISSCSCDSTKFSKMTARKRLMTKKPPRTTISRKYTTTYGERLCISAYIATVQSSNVIAWSRAMNATPTLSKDMRSCDGFSSK